jgi:NAD(P)-dependent dehydrogenase (short-subunit alcohol dehydrogenase family)
MTIALITGGSRGLGRSAALHCAARGSGVILTYNNHPEGADAVVREVEAAGGTAVALKLDVADTRSFPAFRDAVTAALAATWGRSNFDHLVNNAGYGLFNPIATVTEAEFDGLFAVHLKGPFFLTQILLPLIADGGAIVNLTSATTRVATPGVAPYGQGVRRSPDSCQCGVAGCDPHRSRRRIERRVRGAARRPDRARPRGRARGYWPGHRRSAVRR